MICPIDLSVGALPQNPNYFFVLTQKSNQKRSRLSPPRAKNLRSTASRVLGINSPSAQTKKIFNAVFTCFSAHRPRAPVLRSSLGNETDSCKIKNLLISARCKNFRPIRRSAGFVGSCRSLPYPCHIGEFQPIRLPFSKFQTMPGIQRQRLNGRRQWL